MNFFANHLARADAKVKLAQRESELEPEVPDMENQMESKTMLVEIQLDRLEEKREMLSDELNREDDEQLAAITRAKLKGIDEEQEVLESWLKTNQA